MTQENLSIRYKYNSFKLVALALASTVASALSGYLALTNNSAITFNKVITLDPLASTMLLAATASFFGLAVIKFFGVLFLPDGSEKAITLTDNSITLPVGFFLNRSEKINFRDIQSMTVTTFRGRGVLGIRSKFGHVKVIADMLPDIKTFMFVATFLKAKSGAAIK